ncbi:MAG: hypothetical protein MHM6MM_000721 [Cercozoa sp. M6MM]
MTVETLVDVFVFVCYAMLFGEAVALTYDKNIRLGDAQVSWVTPTEATQTHVQLKLTLPASFDQRWYAIGVGTQMVGSKCILINVDTSDTSAWMSMAKISAYSGNGISRIAPEFDQVGATVDNDTVEVLKKWYELQSDPDTGHRAFCVNL